MESNLIVTYAILNAFRKSGRDVVECFYPIVLDSLPEKGQIEFPDDLKLAIKEKYNLIIPTHTLFLILKGLKRNKYCFGYYSNDSHKWLWELTEKGLASRNSYLKTKNEIKEEVTYLCDDIFNFILQESSNNNDSVIQSKLSKELTIKLLDIFITRHLIEFIDFINPSKRYVADDFKILKSETESEINLSKDELNRSLKYLIRYVVSTKKSNLTTYKKFLNIVWGSLITATLFSQNKPTSLQNINKTVFQNMTAFLDTNIILSILDMRPKGLCSATHELLQYLNDFKINLKILDITFIELKNVLKNFNEWYEHPEKIFSNNELYQTMKENGYTPITLQYFFDSYTTKFTQFKISIQKTDHINFKSSEETNKEYLKKLEEIKGARSSNKHDILAIEYIRRERKELPNGDARNFSEIRSFMLSSDKKLAEFNYFFYGHNENQTYTEVFFDRNFMSVLWLNTQKNVPDFESIILSYIPNNGSTEYINFLNTYSEINEVNKTTVQDLFLTKTLYPQNNPIKSFDPIKVIPEKSSDASAEKMISKVTTKSISLEIFVEVVFLLIYIVVVLLLINFNLLQGIIPFFGLVMLPIPCILFIHTIFFRNSK